MLRTSIESGGERTFVLWDDAMISMRYAKHLAEGSGLAWNAGFDPAGARVQGISNLGVTLAMTALHGLPLPETRAALAFQILSLALLCACLALTARLAELLAGEAWAGLAAALALALWAPFSVWGLQGADTTAAALCALAALVAIVRAERAGVPWPRRAFAWLALGLVVRLDAAFGAAAIGAVGLVARSGRRAAGFGLALGALTLAALLAFGQLYYGDPLPNTFYLKATGSPRALVLASGLEQTAELLRGLSWPVSIWLAGGLLLALGGGAGACAAALFVLATLAYNLWTGGDWGTGLPSRFAVPALPVAFALALAAPWRSAFVRRHANAARALGLVLGAALGFAASSGQARSEWYATGAPTLFHDKNRELVEVGRYLRAHTAPDTVVAYHWAGTAAYFAERPAVDVLGKSDRHIAKLEVDRFHPGHSKWDWDYVIHVLRPDIVMGKSRGLTARDDFRTAYRPTADGKLFVRRGSEGKLRDPALALIDW